MHRRRLSTVVIDCKVEESDSAALFWSRALGRAIRPQMTDSNYRELATAREELILLKRQQDNASV